MEYSLPLSLPPDDAALANMLLGLPAICGSTASASHELSPVFNSTRLRPECSNGMCALGSLQSWIFENACTRRYTISQCGLRLRGGKRTLYKQRHHGEQHARCCSTWMIRSNGKKIQDTFFIWLLYITWSTCLKISIKPWLVYLIVL